MILRRRRRPVEGRPLDRQQRRVIWQVLAVLLDYPGDGHESDLDLAGSAVHEITPAAGVRALESFIRWWMSIEAIERASVYVETFDMTHRCSLNLTYYSEGDRRERGSALLDLKRLYEQRGAAVVSRELPDYLPLMLEFAASCPEGESLLGRHGLALAALSRALADADSPFRVLVDTIRGMLPAGEPNEYELERLAANGPPTEEVGLDPPEVVPSPGECRGGCR